MESALEIMVNGQKMIVPAHDPLIKGLRSQGISVPGLCYHPAVKSTGSCGLCLVEVLMNNTWKITRACLLKPLRGLQVRTDSPKIKKMRAVSARLLINQGPFKADQIEPVLRNLILEGNLPEPVVHADHQNSPLKTAHHGCILCGLCVRMCSAYGKRHLTFGGRGKDLNVYYVAAGNDSGENPCGKCHACRSVCPVGYIDTMPVEIFLKYPSF